MIPNRLLHNARNICLGGYRGLPDKAQIAVLKFWLKVFWSFRMFLQEMVSVAYKGYLPKHFSEWGTVPFLMKGICAGDSVLDIGCANGLLTLKLGDKAGHVIGIDVHEGSILSAKRANDRLNVEFICDNAEENFPKGTYDVVILSSVLTFIKNPGKFLNRLHEITGKILIRETRFDENHLVLVSRDLGIPKQPWPEFDSAALKGLLEEGGWDVEVERQTFEIFLLCKPKKQASAAEGGKA